MKNFKSLLAGLLLPVLFFSCNPYTEGEKPEGCIMVSSNQTYIDLYQREQHKYMSRYVYGSDGKHYATYRRSGADPNTASVDTLLVGPCSPRETGTRVVKTGGNGYSREITYQNGVLIRDFTSSVTATRTEEYTTNYSYNEKSQLVRMHTQREIYGGTRWSQQYEEVYYWDEKGNKIKQTSAMSPGSMNGNDGAPNVGSYDLIEYDDNPKAFTALKDKCYDGSSGYSGNNITRIQKYEWSWITHNMELVKTLNYTYEYNAQGLPTAEYLNGKLMNSYEYICGD